MNVGDGMFFGGAVVALLSISALLDLHRVESGSLTIYTTPALRDVLEKGIIPAWVKDGGPRVEPVYVAAGEQYNRLRMSGAEAEADLFLHGSPLYINKGFDENYFLPLRPHLMQQVNASYVSKTNTTGGEAWYAFAWSPLVEVYSPLLASAPDLATAELKFGLPHPTLSNNGIYTVLFFEELSPEAGEHAQKRTVVQPVNARTNILGVADGSFDVTLGYEAVAKFFAGQGARIKFEAPLLNGNTTSTPVLFTAGLVDGPRTEEAKRFVNFLFTNETQKLLSKYHFRSVYDTIAPPRSNLPANLTFVQFDWADWKGIEKVLPRYEVGRARG